MSRNQSHFSTIFSAISSALSSLAFLAVLAASPTLAQDGAPNGEWPSYGGDLGHTRYAALDQINADNFADLDIAWRFKTDNFGPSPE